MPKPQLVARCFIIISSGRHYVLKKVMLQKGVKTKEKVSKVPIGNESVGRRDLFRRHCFLSQEAPFKRAIHTFFLGHLRWFTFLQMPLNEHRKCHCELVKLILLYTCPRLLQQAWWRGMLLFGWCHDNLLLFGNSGHPSTPSTHKWITDYFPPHFIFIRNGTLNWHLLVFHDWYLNLNLKPKPHNITKCLLPTFDCWSCLWSWNKQTSKTKIGKMLYCMLQMRNKTNIILKFTFVEIATICPLTLFCSFYIDLQYLSGLS